MRVPLSSCSVLLRNAEGVQDLPNKKENRQSNGQSPETKEHVEESNKVNVVTRSKYSENFKNIHSLVMQALEPIEIDSGKFKAMQQSCESLKAIRENVICGTKDILKKRQRDKLPKDQRTALQTLQKTS